MKEMVQILFFQFPEENIKKLRVTDKQSGVCDEKGDQWGYSLALGSWAKLLHVVCCVSYYSLLSVRSNSYVGLLWVLGIRILRLRERARRSTASPMVPPNSFLEVRPSMLPLYHMTQPARDSSTRRAPVYTSRSPKSRPWISSGAKTPNSRDITPSRSMSTANTRASLQWDRPSYLGAMAVKWRRKGRQRSTC